MSRLLLVSGKGGVGKTTLAAATAVLAASRGKKSLIASLDRAHNLSDIFAVAIGSDPQRVSPTLPLFAIEIDPQEELRRQWSTLQRWFGALLHYLGVPELVADELAILPGLEELLVLNRLSQFVTSGEYDLVVADLAPTASSLRYLSFPDLVGGRLGAWIRLDQRFMKIFRPLLEATSLPVPEDAAYHNLYALGDALDGLRKVLQDVTQASIRLVMNAEPIVLEETRRARTLFELFGIHVDAVIANRLLPPDIAQTTLGGWLAVQANVLSAARESFADLAFLPVAFQAEQVRGIDALRTFGDRVYGDRDVLGVMAPPRGISFSSDGALTTVSIFLPDSKALPPDLKRRDRDLIISVGGWRRTIALPDSFASQRIAAAKLEGDYLKVTFSATQGRTV